MRLTAATGSSLIAALVSSWCSSPSPPCCGYWQGKGWCCRARRPVSLRSRSRGPTGSSTAPTRCGVGARPTSRARTGLALAIVDLVSRKWIATLVTAEETSTQVEVVFDRALCAEGFGDEIDKRALAPAEERGTLPPLLLAVSDNGPQMTSGSTAEYMALYAIVQHFGRPGVPTDQAPIGSFFGHLKGEFPHLEQIRDPAQLEADLERLRVHYNTVRLNAGFPQEFTITEGSSGRNSRVVSSPDAGCPVKVRRT